MYNCALSACKQNDGNCRETEVVQEITATVSLHQKKASFWQLKKLAHQKKDTKYGY